MKPMLDSGGTPRNNHLVKQTFILWTGLLMLASTARAAADCDACKKTLERLKPLHEEKTRVTALLGKNRAYLADLSPGQASKFLKVESNIEVILKNLDEIKKQIATVNSEFKTQGCEACNLPVPVEPKNNSGELLE